MNKAAFERKMEINFWFEYTEEIESLSFEEREILEEQAKSSILRFIIHEGYTAGELCKNINGKELYGWWNYEITFK